MSAPIKTIYAPEHARMLKALTDEGAVLVYHRSGPTWDDGGAWHRIVARMTDGTHVSIKMESDYAPDVLIIEPLKQWPPMDEKDARIADLERQLDATLMELAETQALELQHGAVIERLQRQLAEAREVKP